MRGIVFLSQGCLIIHPCRLIGNGGDSPNGSGGMIPSTAPPFAMTRWVAQTRENNVSVTPYNYSDTIIHGFQGTHQPAIWMGESAQVVVVPGAGTIRSVFGRRGMRFSHRDEVTTPSYYRVRLDAIEGGSIVTEQSASTCHWACSQLLPLLIVPAQPHALATSVSPSRIPKHLMYSSRLHARLLWVLRTRPTSLIPLVRSQ